MKSKIIDYDLHINEFSVERVIMKFKILHPHIKFDEEAFRNFLSDYKSDCCSEVLPLEVRKYNNKIYKDKLGALMDSYCSLKPKYTGIKFIDDMVFKYRWTPGNVELNSAIITILRIPNWAMISDKELMRMNKNKKPEDLGVLDTDTCPYGTGDVPLNINELPEKVFCNVENYVENNFSDQPSNLRNHVTGKKMLFNLSDLKRAIRRFRSMVKGEETVIPGLESVIDYYRNLIKEDLPKVYRKNEEGYHEDSFMETESGCQLNSYRSILSIINEKASIGRISNTIGNYFAGDSKYLNEKMREVIPFNLSDSGLHINMDCVDFSYGKGDAYKDRKVYILWTPIQNILGPLAQKWSDAQEKYGYNLIGTTHQHELLNKVGKGCKDGIGIDYHQYSDYLFKGVFYEILTILGFNEKESTDICEMVSLPIIYKGKLYPVKLASNMGVKLDFLLITEANLYMYAISCLISGRCSDEINVVGDDRWEILNNVCYNDREFYIKLQVACSFNCQLNPEKTSWLQRDGIFGGCHVWYNIHNQPSTGIAPSQLLKDFYQISDYNSLINKIIDSGQEEIYTQEIIDNLLNADFSMELLKAGNQYFGYKDKDLVNFINIAHNIPYQFGGLGYKLEELDPRYYVKPIFQNLVNILKKSKPSDFTRFITVFGLENNFITISLNNRKGAKNIKQLMDLMRRIKMLNQPGLIDNKFLQSIRKDIQGYFDLERRLENRGRSSSTKNRRGLHYDSDKLFRTEHVESHISVFDYRDDLMSKQLLLDFHNSKDKVYLMKLFSYSDFMTKVEGSIGIYYNAYEGFWGLKTNEFPNRYIRLETEWNNRYEDTCVTLKELKSSPNYLCYKEIKEFLEQSDLYKTCKIMLENAEKIVKHDYYKQILKEEAYKMSITYLNE